MLLANPRSKAVHLENFEKARRWPLPDENVAGRGYPDPDIVPFCDWLNEHDGVYTLQSCAGHKARAGHGASQGCLWVWLDKPFQDRLRAKAGQFVGGPIDYIAIRYVPEGEFVELLFRGNESDQLGVSLAALKILFAAVLDD